ncbi:ComF family protein [Streptococcus hongkongensis]|nr:hypothetical protein NC01_08875 [Streptococcus uberis]
MAEKCLLCSEIVTPQLRMFDIILMKNVEKLICTTCQCQFEKIRLEHCQSCWKSGTEVTCYDCRRWNAKEEVVSHTAIYKYNEAMKEYFSKYKFQGDFILKKIFSQELRKHIEKNYKNYTYLVVPVSKSRYEARGFNQVASILDDAGLSYLDILHKKEGQSQSEKSRSERLASDNQFEIINCQKLPQKVLIIDDVYTTGTTIYQIKKLLKEKGVSIIKSTSIAR